MPISYPVKNANARALLLAILLGGCAQGSALGQVEFNTNCGSEELLCAVLGLDIPLAQGAQTELQLQSSFSGSSGLQTALMSAAPEVLVVEGRTLRGVSTGMSSVLVLTDAGEVLDFSHVFVQAPTALRLERLDPTLRMFEPIESKLQMLVGDEIVLAAQLMAQASPLLGTADVVWSSDQEGLSLLARGDAKSRRVVARESGMYTVQADSLGHSQQVEIEVLP